MSDFKQVNKEIENHYSQFYKSKIEENDLQQRFESFVENLDFTQLQEHENQELEDEISIEKASKITNLLVMMASQKSSMKLSLTF